MWFELKGDERITHRCATKGCCGQATWRLEVDGYGSVYCSGCKAKIEGTFIHIEPKADACDHDFKGWREFEDGNGGEQVCTKCGTGAMRHSLMTSD